MSDHIAFLHTAQVHVDTFETLVAAHDTNLRVRHLVDESLLADAVSSGITPELITRIQDTMHTAGNNGAAVVVCTCSTIGGVAEQTTPLNGKKMMRIDRAMADLAVRQSDNILVLAAVESTLEPTRALLQQSAERADRKPQVSLHCVPNVWDHFQNGQAEPYYLGIIEYLEQHKAGFDCVVLAQASMAEVVQRLPQSTLPILASPALGVDSAVAAWQQHTGNSQESS